MNPLERASREVAATLTNATSGGGFIVFTGAGMSTKSGIPDFRSPGGVWSKYSPVYYDDFVKSEESRHEYWRQKSEAHADFAAAEPNAGHQILADWERRGWVAGVVTQNIDGLHQAAGSNRVLELHGTARKAKCLECSFIDDVDSYVQQFLEKDQAPRCPTCNGPLKHATISFGQPLPGDEMMRAFQWARDARAMLVLGSSLSVHPAADVPRVALQYGAKLYIINRTETPLDEAADFVIRESIGDALSLINELATAAG